MILLALDLSTKATGIAIFKDEQLIHYECKTCSSSDTLKRIDVMTERIIELWEKYHPTNVVIEDVIPEDVRHNQSVYKALIYTQAAVVLAIHKLGGQPPHFYVSSEWRKKVGIHTGRGVKRETLKQASINLVKKEFSIDVSDDIADAICIGKAYLKDTYENSGAW